MFSKKEPPKPREKPYWETTYIHTDSHPFKQDEMDKLLNNGWEFMGIQSTGAGYTSYAYFRRLVK